MPLNTKINTEKANTAQFLRNELWLYCIYFIYPKTENDLILISRFEFNSFTLLIPTIDSDMPFVYVDTAY